MGFKEKIKAILSYEGKGYETHKPLNLSKEKALIKKSKSNYREYDTLNGWEANFGKSINKGASNFIRTIFAVGLLILFLLFMPLGSCLSFLGFDVASCDDLGNCYDNPNLAE